MQKNIIIQVVRLSMLHSHSFARRRLHYLSLIITSKAAPAAYLLLGAKQYTHVSCILGRMLG